MLNFLGTDDGPGTNRLVVYELLTVFVQKAGSPKDFWGLRANPSEWASPLRLYLQKVAPAQSKMPQIGPGKSGTSLNMTKIWLI